MGCLNCNLVTIIASPRMSGDNCPQSLLDLTNKLCANPVRKYFCGDRGLEPCIPTNVCHRQLQTGIAGGTVEHYSDCTIVHEHDTVIGYHIGVEVASLWGVCTETAAAMIDMHAPHGSILLR